MTQDEFRVTIATLESYFPSMEISKETKNAYWLKFRNVDGLEFANACNRAVEKSDFFPTVHGIMTEMVVEIPLERVVFELRGIMTLSAGESFSSKDIHPVTKQILDEIGGKMSLGQLTEDKFQYKVNRLYKYAIAGIRDDKPQIGTRTGAVQIGEAIEIS